MAKERTKRHESPGSTPAGHGMSDAARVYYKGNRYKQLRAFVATVKLGSVTRAAEALYLSQSAVSLQLQALERELDTSLLERAQRRMRPTDAGKALYKIAQPLIERWDSLDRDFNAQLAGLGNTRLRIAAGTSTIQYLLPPMVRAYREMEPAVRLELVNVTGKDGLAMLRSDKVDFAVGAMFDVPPDMAWESVYEYDPMLIMPRDHPLASRRQIELEDLSPYGLILPPERLTTYRQVDFVFQKHRVPYHVALEVGGWEVIKHYVAIGLGISIVTSICLTGDDHRNLAVHNMQAWFDKRHYGVVMRKGKYLGREARAFIDLIRPGLLTHREYDDTGHSSR